ncbi:MAG: HRDC domain-containing protein [Bacteroidia bacterium]|nr:HRDC domain-containing protein [Bacteroidia bacterium]
MFVNILTLPFLPEIEGFNDRLIQDFCANKRILHMESHFFIRENKPYWTILFSYESLLPPIPAKSFRRKEDESLKNLDEAQLELFELLRNWRIEKATSRGCPPFLVATNEQFVQMIQRKVATKADFELIPRYGKKLIARYANDIIHIIQNFYQQK